VTFGKIIFPWGFAGNHVRWLLFLDSRFPNPFGNSDIDSKFDFIKESVYDQTRSWNNWLGYEWMYRDQLNEYLTISHDCYEWEKHPENKELYLAADNSDLPFKHYFHINLGCNNQTPEQIKRSIENWIQEYEVIKQRIQEFPNKKIIKIDSLFEPELDYEFYKELINFYNFDDNYQRAADVHRIYNQCRLESGKKFYEYFTSERFSSILNEFKIFSEIKNLKIEDLQ
jgi:hypothetical protein